MADFLLFALMLSAADEAKPWFKSWYLVVPFLLAMAIYRGMATKQNERHLKENRRQNAEYRKKEHLERMDTDPNYRANVEAEELRVLNEREKLAQEHEEAMRVKAETELLNIIRAEKEKEELLNWKEERDRRPKN